MSKHTDGPWTVSAWTDGALLIDSVDDHPASVAVALVPQHMANQTANARLIAAAPDMLALLERLAGQESGHAVDMDGKGTHSICWPCRAAELVARIKGE